jgi:amidase
MEYWNSTSEKTHTGRPVDAVICPVTPLPSIRKPTGKPRPGYFRYAGWVNGLDYTSVVLPITTVDKAIDVVDKKYKPRDNADDKACYEDCKLL